MIKKKKILLIFSLIFLVGGGYIIYHRYFRSSIREKPVEKYLPNSVNFEDDCDKLEEQIKVLLGQANHCQRDSDCELVDVSLRCCAYGCYNLVNKNEDPSVIEEGAEMDKENCGRCHCNCLASPKAEEIKCRNGKCVDIRYELE